jgi:hypothetical protein
VLDDGGPVFRIAPTDLVAVRAFLHRGLEDAVRCDAGCPLPVRPTVIWVDDDITTKGVTRAERTIERRADGSYVEREITEYHHPAEVLKVLPRLLPGGTPAPPAEKETP